MRLVMSSFVVTTSRGERRETSDIYGVEAKDAAKHPIMLKTAPLHDNKEYPQMFILPRLRNLHLNGIFSQRIKAILSFKKP